MSDELAGGRGSLFAKRVMREELPEQPLLVELENYWNSLPSSNGLPSRRDIDPTEIGGGLLPWIFMLDVIREDGELDYLYRLTGTSNVELVERDSPEDGQVRYLVPKNALLSSRRSIRQ